MTTPSKTVTAQMNLQGLRAIAQSIVDDCDHVIDDGGVAETRAVLTRATCRTVIAVIDLADSWPPETAPATLPTAIKESLDLYARAGLQPGHCLRAVLENDLAKAFDRADPETAAAMPAIVAYLRNNLPCACWGSPEAVTIWLGKVRS